MKNTIRLNTGVVITYKEQDNIKTCKSIYDNDVTNQPLPSSKAIRLHSSYVQLEVEGISKWYSKFKPQIINK